MKRRIVDDLLKVYRSLKCITDEDENGYCFNCKNFHMCTMLGKLISSMEKYY